MSPEERQLLTALFDRVKTASTTPRDRDAETLIDDATRQQPYAAYYLAQAVIVQEKGLEAASARISLADLEGLPQNQKEALILTKVHGHSLAEAAMITGSTPGAIKLRAHRAYVTLRARLLRRGASPEEST